ncbi:Endonuclease/exonuclease/phosphatase [Parasponia andersonii]|uniref:Endonuclease/exonuclease/phosphatase n=1 Tax=Parasponia andersonii TaxID=3476 RepID=A0A2P5AE66_PARAD|nr:Endonuclease/exonuclease/phosphatase [Parasponia andersonii]
MELDEISKLCAGLILDEDDGPLVQVERSLYEHSKERMDNCLIGKVLGNRIANGEGLRKVMKNVWRVPNSFQVEPMNSTNLFVTWNNKRGSNANIQECLDRFVGNDSWHNLFPHHVVKYLDFSRSDHRPIILCLEFKLPCRGIEPFHFEPFWMHEVDYTDLIYDFWASSGSEETGMNFGAIRTRLSDCGNLLSS